MHGIGVSTPSAAAVAATTIGLDGLEHMPNGGTLTIGAKSIMVAAGVPVRTRLAGNTASVDGAAPKLHCMSAPAQTWHPINRHLPRVIVANGALFIDGFNGKMRPLPDGEGVHIMSLIEIIVALAFLLLIAYVAMLLRTHLRVADTRHAEVMQTLASLQHELAESERRQAQRNQQQIADALRDLIADFNDKIMAQFAVHLSHLAALGERHAELAAKHRNEQMEAMHHARRLADRMDSSTDSFGKLVADSGELLALAGQVREALALLGPRQDALDGEILRQAEAVAAMGAALDALRGGFEQAADHLLQQTRRSLDAMAQRQAQGNTALQKELNEALMKAITSINKQLSVAGPAKLQTLR